MGEGGSYSQCFQAVSVLAIFEFARCGGGSNNSFFSCCLCSLVVDKHLTDELVVFLETIEYTLLVALGLFLKTGKVEYVGLNIGLLATAKRVEIITKSQSLQTFEIFYQDEVATHIPYLSTCILPTYTYTRRGKIDGPCMEALHVAYCFVTVSSNDKWRVLTSRRALSKIPH